MLGESFCTACMSSEPHGNVVRKHADGTCSCFGQHVNRAQERRRCPENEPGLHVWAGHRPTCDMAILPQYLMDITIQQLPYNITNIIKATIKTLSLFLMTPEPSL